MKINLFKIKLKLYNYLVDYLTWVSGINYELIKDQNSLEFHKQEIKDLLSNKKIVGHTL